MLLWQLTNVFSLHTWWIDNYPHSQNTLIHRIPSFREWSIICQPRITAVKTNEVLLCTNTTRRFHIFYVSKKFIFVDLFYWNKPIFIHLSIFHIMVAKFRIFVMNLMDMNVYIFLQNVFDLISGWKIFLDKKAHYIWFSFSSLLVLMLPVQFYCILLSKCYFAFNINLFLC
jgi:hypothetical protein